MPKRKEKDNDSNSDGSILDIDFEFFDITPTDYLALKRLLLQLFQSDAEVLPLHELVELVLSQPLIGTTVKTDGRESDPYAFLSVLNLDEHNGNPAIRVLTGYLLKKAASLSSLHSTLQTLLSSRQPVGFILSERLINMPVQIVPPMYRMLAEEIKWANEENEPYAFSHYLFITRTYRLFPEDEPAIEDSGTNEPPAKRLKGKDVQTSSNGDKATAHSFHPEDEQIQKFASHVLDYEFANVQRREKDTLGLDTAARMMLVPAEKFSTLIEAMEEAFAPPS